MRMMAATEAFSDLVREHYDGVLRMSLSVLRRRHDAEEVCQEAFLRAYQNRDRFDPAQSFKTWIFTIAYRLTLNRMRDDRSTRRAESLKISAEPMSIPDQAELSEMAGRLDRYVRDLPAEDQLLLHYRFREDMKFQEIATVVGAAESAVRVRFFRLLERIRGGFKP